MPRIVLAEFNTHRVFSRNSASSRAIPVEKMLQRVMEDPFIPVYWGKNQKGMQADQELTPLEQEYARTKWLEARDAAVTHTRVMLDLGIHKQITNRLIEPWLWQTIIVSSTEWDNFRGLRKHPDAQPEIRKAAVMMFDAMDASTPYTLDENEWHLPLTNDYKDLVAAGFTTEEIIQISVGRCARVSYLTHDGIRDPHADIALAARLQASGHMSPFEHAARPMTSVEAWGHVEDPDHFTEPENPFLGNFRGWVQYRKTLINEDNFLKTLGQ